MKPEEGDVRSGTVVAGEGLIPMNSEDEYLELSLTECHSGEEGEITAITGDCSIARRLRELGLEAGSWIRVAQEGSPVIIHSGETRLCLRSELAASIRMRIGAMFPFASPPQALPSDAVSGGTA